MHLLLWAYLSCISHAASEENTPLLRSDLPVECDETSIFALGVSIYRHGAELNFVFLLVILFTVTLEVGMHFLTRNAPEYFRTSLHHLTQELALLGIVAFILMTIQSAKLSDRVATDVEAFEWCHISLFFVALFNIMTHVYLTLLLRRQEREYRLYERENKEILVEGIRQPKSQLHLVFELARYVFESDRRHFFSNQLTAQQQKDKQRTVRFSQSLSTTIPSAPGSGSSSTQAVSSSTTSSPCTVMPTNDIVLELETAESLPICPPVFEAGQSLHTLPPVKRLDQSPAGGVRTSPSGTVAAGLYNSFASNVHTQDTHVSHSGGAGSGGSKMTKPFSPPRQDDSISILEQKQELFPEREQGMSDDFSVPSPQLDSGHSFLVVKNSDGSQVAGVPKSFSGPLHMSFHSSFASIGHMHQDKRMAHPKRTISDLSKMMNPLSSGQHSDADSSSMRKQGLPPESPISPASPQGFSVSKRAGDEGLEFSFAEYLIRCTRQEMLSLLRVGWPAWSMILLVLVIHQIPLSVIDEKWNAVSHYVLVPGIFLLSVFIVIWGIVFWSHWRCVRGLAQMAMMHSVLADPEERAIQRKLEAILAKDHPYFISKSEKSKAKYQDMELHRRRMELYQSTLRKNRQSWFPATYPDNFILILQVLMICIGFYLSLFILTFAPRVGMPDWHASEGFLWIVGMGVPLVIYAFLLPNIVFRHAFLISVGDRINLKVMRGIEREHAEEKARRERLLRRRKIIARMVAKLRIIYLLKADSWEDAVATLTERKSSQPSSEECNPTIGRPRDV